MDVGAQLREARESRGLSIAALASRTRIQPRALEGIERNDLSVVPPPPYNRAFVATLAREVGLNPDQVVREYFVQFQPPAPVAHDLQPDGDSTSHPPVPLPLLAGAVLVLLLGVLVASRVMNPSTGEPGAVGTSGQVAAPVSPTSPAATTPPSTSASTSQAAPPAGTSVVVLTADRPAWIEARVDGVRRVYQIVIAGTTHTLTGREIAIRVGDAGAVRWSVNGGAAVPMGAPGQVLNVRIPSR